MDIDVLKLEDSETNASIRVRHTRRGTKGVWVSIVLKPHRLRHVNRFRHIFEKKLSSQGLIFLLRERKIKNKTRKQNFHGIVPEFCGEFCLCVFSPIRNEKKKHINKFLAPTQSRDNPANLFMFMCVFFPWSSFFFGRRFPCLDGAFRKSSEKTLSKPISVRISPAPPEKRWPPPSSWDFFSFVPGPKQETTLPECPPSNDEDAKANPNPTLTLKRPLAPHPRGAPREVVS